MYTCCMSNFLPRIETEPLPVEDDARKFTLEGLSADFLRREVPFAFDLAVDWIDMGTDSETKVARKSFGDGTVETLRISKAIKDGKRVAVKKPIAQDAYEQALENSVCHIKKRRYEFKYVQNHVIYSLKYDEFEDSDLRLLEVDAPSEEERANFDLGAFPVALTEVSDDDRYSGYRIASML